MPISTPAPVPPRPFPWIVLGLILLAFAVAAGWLTRDADRFLWIYRENGPFEATELLVNGLVSFVFILRAWRRNDIVGAWCVVLAAAFAAAALHEFPRCGGTVTGMDSCIPPTAKKIAFASIAAIMAGALLYRRQSPLESLRPRWLLLFWPLLTTVALFGLSQIADELDLMSYEEFLEFSGGIAALALAGWILRRT